MLIGKLKHIYAFQNGPFQQFLSTNNINVCFAQFSGQDYSKYCKYRSAFFQVAMPWLKKSRQIFPFQHFS